MGWKYDDEARVDPERLETERQELLELADVGDELRVLAERMAEVMARVPRASTPAGGLETMVEDARRAVWTVGRQVERAFSGAREQAENPTYLGNRAAARAGHWVPDSD